MPKMLQKAGCNILENPFSIRSSRFLVVEASIANLTPKTEPQPMQIGYARVSTREPEFGLAARKVRMCSRSQVIEVV
jgi:hypothetical protein